MAEELSDKQRKALEVIREAVRRRGYPPSVREIGQAIGVSSSSTVHSYLNRLEQLGKIRRDPTKPRAIEVLDAVAFDHPAAAAPSLMEASVPQQRVVSVPLVGQVTAGQPILAVESIEEQVPLPADLVGNGELFILSVRGDSMINAGILDGDYVVVRRQADANNGDIVVAMIEDEATVKRFYREADHIRLQPENDALEPIRVRDVQVLGKVVALFRRVD